MITVSPASRLRTLALPQGPAVVDALAPLSAALDGGPPLFLYAAGASRPQIPATVDAALPDDLALVVTTSGSSGRPKHVMLGRDALLASVGAAYEALGGPGNWLLALPPHHIAGVQVLLRALLGADEPVVMDLSAGFTANAFIDAAARMPATGEATYVSLVPTQLSRLLENPEATTMLAGFDAVLCGGAPTSSSIRERARAAGITAVLSYGMTETAGGCVYDGRPLPGSLVHIDNDRHVVLGGASVALGYLGEPELTADGFHVDADGTRWFSTADLGRLDDEGRLQITGRADQLINTGGIKVAPGPVEDALLRYVQDVRDAVVLGAPHPEWGEVVAAVVTLVPHAPHPPTVSDVRRALRNVVDDAALPRLVRVVDDLPRIGPGKIDKSRLVDLFVVNMDVIG